MSKGKKRVVVDGVEETTPKILANSIIRLSEAADKMMEAGLSRRAIILLLHDASRVPKSHIDAIRIALRDLRLIYTTTGAA